jgi:DNA-binding NarL/FixJ family response regulator
MAGQPMVHTMRPDITLLDLHLEVSPDETIRSIFSMSLDSAIVVLTKEDDDVLEARCFNAGAEDYVLKSHLKDRCFTRILKHAWQRHHATNRLRAKRALFELQKLNEEESSGSGK